MNRKQDQTTKKPIFRAKQSDTTHLAVNIVAKFKANDTYVHNHTNTYHTYVHKHVKDKNIQRRKIEKKSHNKHT